MSERKKIYRTTRSYVATNARELSYQCYDLVQVLSDVPQHGIWHYAIHLQSIRPGLIASDAVDPWNQGAIKKTRWDLGNTPRGSIDEKYVAFNKTESLPRTPDCRHILNESFFVVPIICIHCRDYIWGTGKQGVQCQNCHACFHTICARYADVHLCYRDKNVYPTVPVTYNSDKPISEWTATNVVEWMAGINLYNYADVFKSKNIKGTDLFLLDREKLLNMGIRDEFHQKAILTSVQELCSGQPILSTDHQSNGDNTHRLTTYSFPVLEKCDQCHKYLRGLHNQGVVCQDCKIVSHRTCSANGLKPLCSLSNQREPGQNIYTKSMFGTSLCSVFNIQERPAPKVLMMLTEELERQASHTKLDLYKLYQTSSSADLVNSLRNKIDTDSNNVKLSDYSPQCIVSVMKKFVRELPDPVIPVQFYDYFIMASKGRTDEEAIKSIQSLINKMPEHHRSTLKFIMQHMIRICRFQYSQNYREQPTIMIQVMCHILLRPPWEKIIEIVYNTEYHIRIVELLLYHGEWKDQLPAFDKPPALPPRKLSSKLSLSSAKMSPLPTNSLSSDEWYWGNISKEEVKEKMQNCKDGTFLVRDASSQRGEYTLTLIKDGTEKLIKICQQNGKYGFAEPFKFNTVTELINYYKDVSLKQYNPILDVKLTYPVSRYKEGDETGYTTDITKLVQRFVDIHKDCVQKTQAFDDMLEIYNHTENERNLKRQAHEAFQEAVQMFENQILIQEQYKKQAEPHEVQSVMENFEVLKARLVSLNESKEQLENDLEIQKQIVLALERDINCMKPEKTALTKLKEKYQVWLLRRGVTEYQIKQLMEDGFRSWADLNKDISSYHDVSTWLLQTCSRADAERYLAGLPTGTFLIRPRFAGHYALSISCNGSTNHCIIYKTQIGYGFAIPYNIYDSLKSLVLHYAHNSLEEHNDELTTTLKHPVFSPFILQLQNKSSGGSSGGDTGNLPAPSMNR